MALKVQRALRITFVDIARNPWWGRLLARCWGIREFVWGSLRRLWWWIHLDYGLMVAEVGDRSLITP